MPGMSYTAFISRLGRPEVVADDLKELSGEPVTAHAMSNWGKRGIPRYLRPFVAKLAKKKRIKEVPPEIARFMGA